MSNVAGEGDVKDGSGWISQISLSGETIQGKWLEGLNAPKGMRIHQNTLWVSDIDEVVAIDIPSAKIIRKVPVQGAEFLNDVAVDSKGNVFVSDTPGSTIYRITAGSTVSTFDSGAHLDSPNGLLIDGEILWVASWGLTGDEWSTKAPGGIYSLDLATKKQVWIKKEIGHLDGLEKLGSDFIFSDWMSGSIVQLTPDNNAKTTEILKLEQGAADIAIIDDKTLVVPQMQEKNVSAFSIETIQASATTPAASSPFSALLDRTLIVGPGRTAACISDDLIRRTTGG